MKKIRRLKRFLGVSAIMLAILLANIPFTSTAEDVSGNNTGTTTAGTEASGGAVITPPAVLGVQDTRTDKRASATATFTSVAEDFTLQIADAPAENLDATGFEALVGYLYLQRRYDRLLELIQKGLWDKGTFLTVPK